MGEPMTVDEARDVSRLGGCAADTARALATALAEVERLTKQRDAAEEALAAAHPMLVEVARLRSLPVIHCCAECVHCVKGSARHRCEHLGAPLDDANLAWTAGRRGPMGQCKTVEPDGEPPSWCPLRGKDGGR